ncbi:methyltransferase [Shewanella litorisediminis]|uniref:Ribosomal RNA large subunit methyltransferase G n=1 Tax=Shewanella litorisediminis TaxID=1173586 RepID=A0ABX7G0N0_9GAMM|nr:methyltransferase [Shewanella litorisediminis]MCL2918111.1 methyltransferase [Shewanella litorisediminis]QRH00831.1 methyltransferase [Shewanella litorisediminis]
MTTRFSAFLSGNPCELDLHRFPTTSDPNLQAWDAADEHLLKYLEESNADLANKILVINDSFGALTCALAAVKPDADIVFAADGRTAHLGCKANLAANGLANTNVDYQDCTDIGRNAQGRQILMKLPKNLNFLADTLSQLSQTLKAGDVILLGAKAKHINQSLLALIAKAVGPATASLTWKKTRVITIVADGSPRPAPKPSMWDVPEHGLQVTNLSNVFAASKLDIGARLMMEHLPQGQFTSVIDLGCGNGALGLKAAQSYPDARLYLADESAMAVESARRNWALNGLDTSRAEFIWDDCLSHLLSEVQADLVLCNPPFHQGEAITDHIAWQMFNDARRVLKPGGLLHIVGNRHLGYHIKLKRLFGNCKTIASNGKFVILQAVK